MIQVRVRIAEVEDAGYRDFVSRIGERLRLERKRAGLTLESLADRSGFSLRMVQFCEGGGRAPSLRGLWRLSRALGVDPRAFLPSPLERQALQARMRRSDIQGTVTTSPHTER